MKVALESRPARGRVVRLPLARAKKPVTYRAAINEGRKGGTARSVRHAAYVAAMRRAHAKCVRDDNNHTETIGMRPAYRTKRRYGPVCTNTEIHTERNDVSKPRESTVIRTSKSPRSTDDGTEHHGQQ